MPACPSCACRGFAQAPRWRGSACRVQQGPDEPGGYLLPRMPAPWPLTQPGMQAGATAVVPETLEPGLQLASAVLSNLNMPPDDVQEAIQSFRRNHLMELQARPLPPPSIAR